MDKEDRIYIAGDSGLLGKALLRRLLKEGFSHIITKRSDELDLKNEELTRKFFEKEKPDYVFLLAAKIGGIVANNTYPADFIYENLKIQCNVIHSAYKIGVKKLLFTACSCVYPKDSPQPMREDYLLSGKIEPTSEPFALAKIVGIKMCQSYNRQYKTNFISPVFANLFGPNDNFDLESSHVMAALIRKFHLAKAENKKTVTIWGTGRPKREFMYVDDAADACLFLMQNYNSSDIINVGTGVDISISELANLIKDVIGFEGEIEFDRTKPDGNMRKLLDNTKISSLGWRSKFDLRKGIIDTYNWYLNKDKEER